MSMSEQIQAEAVRAMTELLEQANLRRGDMMVIGCSSSEVMGEHIGKGSSMEAAEAIYAAIAPLLRERGIYLVAQCCEHLNRALIMERECAEKYGYEIVNVMPWPHAGGSFATTVYAGADDPVAVEHVRAHAGMDIGGTLIGMHLRDVAVPVRLSVTKIGQAAILCARTRPKFIGGIRARYPEGEVR